MLKMCNVTIPLAVWSIPLIAGALRHPELITLNSKGGRRRFPTHLTRERTVSEIRYLYLKILVSASIGN